MTMRLVLDLRWVKSPVLDGIGRVSLSLSAELLRQQPDWFFVLLFRSQELQSFGLDWLQHSLPIPIQADYATRVTGFSAHSPLNQVLLWRQLRPLAPSHYFSFYYPFQSLPIPQICMVHDLIPLLFPEAFAQASLAFRLSMTRPALQRWLLQRAQQIVTVSHSTRQDLEQELGLPKHQVAVCYPGVSPAKAVHRPYPGLKSGYILSLGRPDPHKNFQGLIAAYAALPEALQRKHPLVLAGPEDPRYTPALRQQIQQLGLEQTVHLLGPVASADLPALYSHAKIFVLISLYEGFGLPVIEAMSYGIPVLASCRGSLPEVAGDAALLVNPERQAEISWGLQRLLGTPALRQSLRAQGREQAAKFTWEASGQRLAEILLAVKRSV